MKKFISAIAILIVAMASLSIPISSAGHSGDIFPDLSIEDPYYTLMIKLHDQGVIEGNPDGTLGGDEELLRAALVTIVVRAGKITILDSDKNCFPDVKDEWFAGPVCAMVRLQLISGYPDGLFRPGRSVTAGEAAKIILNALAQLGFSDLQEALDYLTNNGLTMVRLQRDDLIIRKEAFARLYLVQERPTMPDQMDSEGNLFDPAADTIMVVEADGQPFYVDYHPDQYARHLGTDPVILFFHAAWCPKCKQSDAVLQEALPDLSGGVVIFKTDYDTETELKKTYGVTLQDTFVVIDAAGEKVLSHNALRSAAKAQELVDKARGL